MFPNFGRLSAFKALDVRSRGEGASRRNLNVHPMCFVRDFFSLIGENVKAAGIKSRI